MSSQIGVSIPSGVAISIRASETLKFDDIMILEEHLPDLNV